MKVSLQLVFVGRCGSLHKTFGSRPGLYIEMYLKKDELGKVLDPIIHEVFNDRWEVAFVPSDGQFQQVFFKGVYF